jgi:hypothetical protein
MNLKTPHPCTPRGLRTFLAGIGAAIYGSYPERVIRERYEDHDCQAPRLTEVASWFKHPQETQECKHCV